jgi:hypothetical protein
MGQKYQLVQILPRNRVQTFTLIATISDTVAVIMLPAVLPSMRLAMRLTMPTRAASLRALVGALLIFSADALSPLVSSSGTHAQMPIINAEMQVAFDTRGRLMTLTPKLLPSTLKSATWWNVPGESWLEARLFTAQTIPGQSNSTGAGPSYVAVLAVTQNNGAILRYGLNPADLDMLRLAFDGDAATIVPGTTGVRSSVELSQPAGYTFVRNQTLLGLTAYGPAMAASLSKSGSTSAVGGYFLAAGSSFFVSAQMIRTRIVTRSQTILGTHAGFRGAAAGAAIAGIAEANDGPGFGVPILVGAVGGTIGGFLAAKRMSDGEAASAGLGADLLSFPTVGISTATGAFDAGRTSGKRKFAFGAAVATAGIGYAVGPQYARRAKYNVTAGDASVALTTALVGAAAGAAVAGNDTQEQTVAAFATAGFLAGFVVADRVLVSKFDHSSSDAGWSKLGALAGGLMGGGLAASAESSRQVAFALVAAGGALGLLASERMIAPGRDAGANRGIMRSSSLDNRSREEDRLQLMIPSAATALVLWSNSRKQPTHIAGNEKRGGGIVNFPAARFTF